MPTPAIAAARACVFARDFTSLDDLCMSVETYRRDEYFNIAEEVQAIDFRPYRIWNTLSILHLTSEFGFLSDLQASVSAQHLASTDYHNDYDDLSDCFWETLDTDLELLSNSMKVLIYVPPPHALSCYKRIIDMTGFRCPLILAPTPALDDIVINGTMSPDEINSTLSRVCLPEIHRSQYKVVTSHNLNENNADTTVDLLMRLHVLSGGFSWEDYGDLANVRPGDPSLQEFYPECHPDEVRKTHFSFLEAGYRHWLNLQTRKVCYEPDPEKNEWDGSLLDILLICNVEKGRRVLGAIVIQNRTG
ncbi:hypothetical protein HDU89_008579 [Geranomyces variabilis]|nr:hypothetical protein HDU89_008579 [Geranomyces variabilis]